MPDSESYVVTAPKQASLPVVGSSSRFPVRRIYCVGKNYVAHVEEMGGDASRDFPIIFQKPTDSIVQNGATIPYPPLTDDFHFELELMVAIKSGGYNIPEEEALDHIFGYGICLDMTRRRLLNTPVGPNAPWELKKSFDQSSPCSEIYPVPKFGHFEKGNIKLTIDGVTKQDSDLSLMIWRTPEIVSTLSLYYSLEPGDIIMTGTPSGVGPVATGNKLEGHIDGLGSLTVTIGDPI